MCWIRYTIMQLCIELFLPLGPLRYRRPSRAPPPRAATFGYYANMVQQIEFLIYTNIQPLRQNWFTQGPKKVLVTR